MFWAAAVWSGVSAFPSLGEGTVAVLLQIAQILFFLTEFLSILLNRCFFLSYFPSGPFPGISVSICLFACFFGVFFTSFNEEWVSRPHTVTPG